MTDKERFDEVRKVMKFITKDDEWYQLIYLEVEKNICRFKKVDKHGSANEQNTKTYEEACELYTIEIIENTPTPDQYFLKKVAEKNNPNIIRTVSDPLLKNYLQDHKDECSEAVEKLKEIVRTHEDYKVRKAAYESCLTIGLDGCEELKVYTKKPSCKGGKKANKVKRPSAHRSKLYNPPVGEFGFCCEEEKMSIVFSHLQKKSEYGYESFLGEFETRYRYEASLLNHADKKRLFQKYSEYFNNGKMAAIRAKRREGINSDLPIDILNTLKGYGLRVVRADGRGTKHQVKKCRRKKQYDYDRLSGYRIISIKKGIPIAGKRYELYENDVKDFVSKLVSGEISLKKALEKERM